jgi:hypothetical protein
VLVVHHAMFMLNFLNNLVIYLVSFPIYVKVTQDTRAIFWIPDTHMAH